MTRKHFLRQIFHTAVALSALLATTSPAAPGLSIANPRVQEVIGVQRTVTPELMALDGILGTDQQGLKAWTLKFETGR